MFIDSATLHDLSVVPTPGHRGTTLWELLDRTRTRAGREQLRARLLRPASSPQEISALQEAHRAIGRALATWRTEIDGAGVDSLERYLNVNWLLPNDMPGPWGRRKWWAQYRRDVVDGWWLLRHFFARVAALRDKAAATESAILRALAARMAMLLEHQELQPLHALVSRATSTTPDLDQQARGASRPALAALADTVGAVEALWSVAAAIAEHGWTYPSIGRSLQALGLRHPFLARTAAVANDLVLGAGVRVCFVTGPNMAGKSTFLKALALAVVLVHLGSGVPAVRFECPFFGASFSSVNLTDSLNDGESFYLAEVRRIRILATTIATYGAVCAVLDEPFRGTNVHDATEATLAIAERLADQTSGLFLIASHLGEVAAALSADPRVALIQFNADLEHDAPRFNYTLSEGISTQRLGMTLLRQEGVLELMRPVNT